MNPPIDQISDTLGFLRSAEKLKDVLRTSYTSSGRRESTAEHTWRLCLMVMAFERALPAIDFTRLLKMCLLHDLGEALAGDTPAIDQVSGVEKAPQERRSLIALLAPLDSDTRDHFLALWDEYESATTVEAQLAKGFDKLETILQHNQGLNPDDFDYAFNLTYGQKYTVAHPLLLEIRRLVDRQTCDRMAARER